VYIMVLLCDRRPVFEVTSTCDRVESYVVLRTGAAVDLVAPALSVFPSLHVCLNLGFSK